MGRHTTGGASMDLASTDLAADLDTSSACGHRRQRCTDVRAPLGGGGGEDAPQG